MRVWPRELMADGTARHDNGARGTIRADSYCQQRPPMVTLSAITIARRRIVVEGIVQGVGFRPFVYGQAQRHSLGGFVRNDSTGVTIEVEGDAQTLEAFEHALCDQAPPLAR